MTAMENAGPSWSGLHRSYPLIYTAGLFVVFRYRNSISHNYNKFELSWFIVKQSLPYEFLIQNIRMREIDLRGDIHLIREYS